MKKLIFIVLFSLTLQASEMSMQDKRAQSIAQLQAAVSKINSGGRFKKALITIFGNTSNLAMKEGFASILESIIVLLQNNKIAEALIRFEALKKNEEFKTFYEEIKLDIDQAINSIKSQQLFHSASSFSDMSALAMDNPGSFTLVMFPIIAALLAPEGKFMDVDSQWNSKNPRQAYFLRNFFSKKAELKNFSNEEIRSWASIDYNELNQIAKENGFNIQLQPFGPLEFGSLAIFDVIIKWLKNGISSTLDFDNEVYKAVRIENLHVFNVYKLNDEIYRNPVVEIKTQNNDRVYMTIADEKFNGFSLLRKINELSDAIGYSKNHHDICKSVHYDSVIFPFVELNQQVDISWIKDMYSNGCTISQALQQTKFKMDENGARVQSAVMVSMLKSIAIPKELKIDKPFYIWIERENCSIPIFAGYIDSSDWVKSE